MVKSLKYRSVKKKPSMVREAVVSVYQSGHSKVVTIPAGFPVEVGDRFEFINRGKRIRISKIEAIDKKDLLDLEFVGLHKDRKGWKNKSNKQVADALRKKAWYGE